MSRVSLRLESLESRDNPAPMDFHVTETALGNDVTAGTLPWAVRQANLNPGVDSIIIDVSVDAAGAPGLRLTEAVKITGTPQQVFPPLPPLLPVGVIIPPTLSGFKGLAVFTFDTPDLTTSSLVETVWFSANDSSVASTAPAGNPDDGVGKGGAIRINAGAVEINGCKFEGNKATEGGAIRLEGGTAQIAYSTFVYNRASTGGAVYSSPQSPTTAVVTVTNSTFDQNRATSNRGGAFYLNRASLVMADSQLKDNFAFRDGAGVYTEDASSCLITNTLFSGNSALESGGAMAILDTPATLTGCRFLTNTAVEGGGAIFVSDSPNAPKVLLITASFFTGNTATSENGKGGAIYFQDATATIQLTSFAANTASRGNGLYMTQASNVTVLASWFFFSSIKTNGATFNATGTFGIEFE